MKLIFSFFCLFCCLNGFLQAQNNQEKIKTLLDTYFLDDREIIHVQFNKNVFLNNEDIAFKGYVFSKNNTTPYLNTSNIQLTIYNEKEEVVQKQLLFTAHGMFSGGIHLNKNFKTGKYLFHFYSNWMNNFKEDDSFSQIIEVNEIDEPFNIKINEPNFKTAKIAFFPEGGAIIDGISNTVGVKITDCNNRGLELNNILIFDSKSNEVSHFNTNKMGNGVLYLTADSTEKYTLKTQSNGHIITQDLPVANQTGIAISYNNNLPNNKLAISVRTNEKGVELNQNKKLNLLIQQNGYSVLKEINFDNQQKDQVVFVDKKYLQNGVNSIRLIDENLNEITERLIYNYAAVQPVVNLIAKVSNDSIILSGVINLTKGTISTSILPEKNIGFDKKSSILGTYYLNTYLETPEIDNFAYFDPENKHSKRDMDYLMQVQTKSKLLWENIKSNPPILNYKFNKGITISGKIGGRINPNANKTVSLISLKNNVFENIKLEKDNTFKLENYFVQDSTVYVLQLENEKNAAVFSKIVAQVSDNQTKFILPIRFNLTKCPIEKMAGESIVFSALKLDKNTIDLDEVLIKQKKKEVLTHNKGISINSIAYKIDDREFGTVLDFIGRNGFRTGVNPSTYDAFINSSRDAFAGGSPEVFVDGVFLFDFNLLFDLDIDTVDEVYIDKSGLGSARLNSSGTIRIFLKRGKENKFYISKCSTLIATSGFTRSIAFQNAAFTTQKEFDLLGTLNWSPNTALKENQNFEIKFPKGNQSIIEVLIEGFSDDGQLISEIKKIPVGNL